LDEVVRTGGGGGGGGRGGGIYACDEYLGQTLDREEFRVRAVVRLAPGDVTRSGVRRRTGGLQLPLGGDPGARRLVAHLAYHAYVYVPVSRPVPAAHLFIPHTTLGEQRARNHMHKKRLPRETVILPSSTSQQREISARRGATRRKQLLRR